MTADPVEVDPKHYKVEFENDRVRVLRIRYGAREKSAMHGHPPGIPVILSECDFRFYFPSVGSRTSWGRAGEIICFDEAFEHLPKNLSAKPFGAVLVELKK